VDPEKEKRDPLQVSGRQADNPARKGDATDIDVASILGFSKMTSSPPIMV